MPAINLMYHLELNSLSALRYAIRKARLDGQIILSQSVDGGYYLPDDTTNESYNRDIQEWLDMMQKKTESTLLAMESARHKANKQPCGFVFGLYRAFKGLGGRF